VQDTSTGLDSTRLTRLCHVRSHAANLQKFAANKQSVESVEADSVRYLEKISKLLAGRASWIFGDDVGPTALDAHTVVFIARLLDAKREHLIPADVLAYGRPKLQGTEWLGITKGNPTLHSLYVKGEKGGH
jgi:hypothetical protein